VPLRGVADRIDLLSDRRLRVIDYKTGYPPQPKRALQVPVYALCVQERLAERGEASGASMKLRTSRSAENGRSYR
jgi:RecB family exonuclease